MLHFEAMCFISTRFKLGEREGIKPSNDINHLLTHFIIKLIELNCLSSNLFKIYDLYVFLCLESTTARMLHLPMPIWP